MFSLKHINIYFSKDQRNNYQKTPLARHINILSKKERRTSENLYEIVRRNTYLETPNLFEKHYYIMNLPFYSNFKSLF